MEKDSRQGRRTLRGGGPQLGEALVQQLALIGERVKLGLQRRDVGEEVAEDLLRGGGGHEPRMGGGGGRGRGEWWEKEGKGRRAGLASSFQSTLEGPTFEHFVHTWHVIPVNYSN